MKTYILKSLNKEKGYQTWNVGKRLSFFSVELYKSLYNVTVLVLEGNYRSPFKSLSCIFI